MSDLSLQHLGAKAILRGKVEAAKLHVLGLAPLKLRLGDRWDRLSGLVHKLFESALSRMQGPSDHFFILDELSYVVTFSGLSFEETNLICTSIAKEVCEHLFGAQIDEVSVRTIVAEITSVAGTDGRLTGGQIESMVERSGIETVVTQSIASGSADPVVSVPSRKVVPSKPEVEVILCAHEFLAQFGLRLGFFPVWELRRETATSLFLNPFLGTAGATVSGFRALTRRREDQILDIEIHLLLGAEAYAKRMGNAGKVCAIGVGVSYDTLCRFHSRIRYITALQRAAFTQTNPLLLKIEQIPTGAPDHRIAELVAMLRFGNVRLTLEFQSLLAAPDTVVHLGVVGMGGALPTNADLETCAMTIEKMTRRATAQKAFVFIDKLDTETHANCARNGNVRFGTGAALGTRELSGLEPIPDFPLPLVDFG